MTIKEAFEALSNACAKGMKNPFFVMKRLKESFADVADKVVDAGGSVVDVVPAQDSGYLVGNIKVDGEDNYLFAPQQVPPLHIYTSEERLVAVWLHDGISEDVYERMLTFTTGISASGDLAIPHGISNVNKVLTFSGYGNVGNGAYTNYSTSNYHLNVHEVNRTNTMWDIGDGIASQISSLVCIVRYTKITV